MSINLKMPDITELKPRITVFGVGGAGCNAVNNMIEAGLQGVEFVVANTDAQALTNAKADRLIQMGVAVTQGLGAGSQPEIGRAAAEETIDEITDHLNGAHMAFITAGMGGGTGTGAAPIVARAAREAGILTVGVVTKPFQFEGQRRMRVADAGIVELQKHVDTLIVIPNQNLFRVANDKTTFADAFAMADEVLYSGVACITDLMVKDGLINLDFADVRSVMREMGKAMMGTGEASGDKRAIEAAEKAIANPLLDDVNMRGARGLLISITGGRDMTLFEVDEAASRVREEVEADANIIFGATFDESLEGIIRVSVVATGIEQERAQEHVAPPTAGMAELSRRLKSVGAPVPIAATAAAQATVAQAQPQPQPQLQPQIQAHQQAPALQPQLPQRRIPDYALEGLEQELAIAVPQQRQSQPQPIARPNAQARQADPGVRIGPFRPDPSLIQARHGEHEIEQVRAHETARAHEAAANFIPPAAERPDSLQPRMPRVEDFPPVAQRQLRAQAAPAHAEEGQKPRGLLARLASGLARHAEPAHESPRQRDRDEPRVAQGQPAPHPAITPAAEFAKPQPRRMGEASGATGTLDPRGRPVPIDPRHDDHLEIPAFLRRQSS
jgi:cell division protein FtsZ